MGSLLLVIADAALLILPTLSGYLIMSLESMTSLVISYFKSSPDLFRTPGLYPGPLNIT